MSFSNAFQFDLSVYKWQRNIVVYKLHWLFPMYAYNEIQNMKRSMFNTIFMTNFNLILFSTFLCSKWGFKDSDLMLRNLLFISFGKVKHLFQLLFMFRTQLASSFHLGDLFLHLSNIKSCTNQFISRSKKIEFRG